MNLPRALALSILLAVAPGCVEGGFFSAAPYCRAHPAAHEGLPAHTAVLSGVHGGSVVFEEGEPAAAVAVRATRRDCLYEIEPRPFAGARRLGPYADLKPLITAPGRARWAMIAAAPSGETKLVVDGVEIAAGGSITEARFSGDGDHFVHLAWGAEGGALYVDGARVGPTQGARGVTRLHAVLDDGRACFEEQTHDGKRRVVVGSWVSAASDAEPAFHVVNGRHFTVVIRHGAQLEVVFDGRSAWPQGEVLTVAMSDDGTRTGYVERRAGRIEAVIDGVPVEVPERPGAEPWMQLFLRPSIAYLAWYPRGRHNHYTVLGVPTPNAQPSPTLLPPGKEGFRVMIGGSAGPMFDGLDDKSLWRDEEGRVHYQGWHEGRPYDVIDNVIQGARR